MIFYLDYWRSFYFVQRDSKVNYKTGNEETCYKKKEPLSHEQPLMQMLPFISEITGKENFSAIPHWVI